MPGAALELRHQPPQAAHGGQLGMKEEQQQREQELGHGVHLGRDEESKGGHGERGQVTGRTGAQVSLQRVCAF